MVISGTAIFLELCLPTGTPPMIQRVKSLHISFGMDCRMLSTAAFLPPTPLQFSDIVDYKEEVTLALSTARTTAAKSIQQAQKHYKTQYDRTANTTDYHVGQWVLVHFPADECGRYRKLSRPWHGPYRATGIRSPDITVSKVYFPQDKPITVHQTRVKPSPPGFPAGFYWYGGTQKGIRKLPQWVELLLSDNCDIHPANNDTSEKEEEMNNENAVMKPMCQLVSETVMTDLLLLILLTMTHQQRIILLKDQRITAIGKKPHRDQILVLITYEDIVVL